MNARHPKRATQPQSKPRPAARAREPLGDAWAGRAALITIALVAVAMVVWTLGWHPTGDYFAESDFYDYARGGDQIRRGMIDPARYIIIGPVYEFALALLGWITPHVFRAATLLSVASAVTVMACWSRIAAERLRPLAGWLVVLLLATNPVFFRYSYTAGTDMLALALQSLSLYFLLARSRRHELLAGGFAGLAILTRYVSLYLLPAVVLFLLARRAPQRRRLWMWALGLALSLGPWTVYSVSQGHVPGAGLVRYYSFYASETTARNTQDLTPEAVAGVVRSKEPVVTMMARRLGEHVRRDAVELLAWPVALLALAGMLLALRPVSAAANLPIVLHACLAFALLLASFYSERYSLTKLPPYLALAALPLVELYRSRDRWRAGALAAGVLLLTALGNAASHSWTLQQQVHSQLPFEALQTAEFLRDSQPRGAVVISRKAAITHFAGAEHVPFPRAGTLAELAQVAKRSHATHLYYSWYEAGMRPEFRYLLDSMSVVPGLERVFKTDQNAAILYEIGPGFGADPAWYADTTERKMREMCGYVRILADSSAAPFHRAIGMHAARNWTTEVALAHFAEQARTQPGNPEGFMLGGFALLSKHRPAEAQEWFRRALQRTPNHAVATAGLGAAEWMSGKHTEAARRLRPVLEQVRDAQVLGELEQWYRAAGDTQAAQRCAGVRASGE